MNKKIKTIVTGGAGFIGSHLVDKLLELGHEVHVVDNLSAESNDEFYFNDDAYYYDADITWAKFPVTIFKKADYVFHLAAESRINPTIKNPVRAVEVNTLGTTKMLQLARENNVKRFIYSSTSAVYGLNCKLPTDENSPIDCLNPYSSSKLGGEEQVKVYSKMFGLDTCIFRYFNVFGERSPTKGQYAPVVGLFLKQLKAKKPLNIVGDGEQRRDFVHVSDIVQANILAMQHSTPINGQVFNIGSGENYSINEIALYISDKIKYSPPREGEARDTMANIGNVSGFLGFNPKINIKDWISDQLK